jgi:hypothetical protein
MKNRKRIQRRKIVFYLIRHHMWCSILGVSRSGKSRAGGRRFFGKFLKKCMKNCWKLSKFWKIVKQKIQNFRLLGEGHTHIQAHLGHPPSYTLNQVIWSYVCFYWLWLCIKFYLFSSMQKNLFIDLLLSSTSYFNFCI